MRTLATVLREYGDAFSLGPVTVSLRKLVEPSHEGERAKNANRSALVRLWEQEYREHPALIDMLKQALGMRMLILVVDTEIDETEVLELSEMVLEELRANR